jgi:hypothetical protein
MRANHPEEIFVMNELQPEKVAQEDFSPAEAKKA